MTFVPIETLSLPAADPADARPVLEGLKSLKPGTARSGSVAVPALRSGEQFRFHFDMRRCLGCRSCEVACNEQNGNPAQVRWRRVGEIEGGGYPHARRHHLSMACNHCLEPSCLEGCPTDAYTKLPNGIVAHDEGACIGCQYCTWSCPYGVPQYDPQRRVVTKCHLCAERLSEGRLPACVEACPTAAIEIEAVDSARWRRAMTGADAPGVPPADLTLSTTRITLPENLPEAVGKVEASRLEPEAPHWALVFLLVLSQWSVGLTAAALLLGASGAPAPAALAAAGALLLSSAALGASLFHLGRPLRALRALRALRRSWLSREAALFLLLTLLQAAAAAALLPDLPLGAAGTGGGAAGGSGRAAGAALLGLALLVGAGGVASSACIYLLPARPAWMSWRTPAQFLLTAAGLGSAAGLCALARPGAPPGEAPAGAWCALAGVASLAALAQALLPWTLAALGLATSDPPVRAAALLLTRRFGRLLWLRTLLLLALAAAALAAALLGQGAALAALAALLLGIGGEIAGRYLFFVTVVPRNMPGHFWSRRPEARP